MKLIFTPILFTALLGLSGCASFSTTPMTRQADNSISGDSNGIHRWFCRTRPYRGVPVKIRVKTHLDVFIKEKYAICRVGGDKVNRWEEKSLGTPEQPLRLLFVDSKPIDSEQIVITDFKRPASGSIDLKLDFTDEQYFKNVESKVVDTTITDSAALLTTILSGTGIIPAKSRLGIAENVDTPDFKWQERTVAYQRFDINAPDFEQQVEAFVNHHLNNCNSCGQFNSPSFDPNGTSIQ